MNEILAEISGLALTLFTICSLGAVGLSMTVPQIVEPLRNSRLLIRLLIGNFVLIPLLAEAAHLGSVVAVVSAVTLRLVWLVFELVLSGILYVGVRGEE